MNWRKEDTDAICGQLSEEMAEMLGAKTEAFDPGKKGAPAKPKTWEPLLSPTQKAAFYDQSDVVGVCGEKFTGKSFLNLHCIAAHCYTEHDALYTIIGNSHRALAEGVCHELMSYVLPTWRDGNRGAPYYWENGVLVPNPRDGELIDNGIGLEFSPWRADPNNKDLYLKIKNKYGGWSRIRVIAIPYPEMVQARVTNLNASGVYLEEATRCLGKDYYMWPQLQLYRRRGIKGAQQFRFSCNPDDPDKDGNDPKKWVWRWLYRESAVRKDEPGKDWPNDPEMPGVRRDPQTAFYYLHYKENMHNVSQKNRETLERTLRTNPIMRARLLECKWVAAPAGDALFKDHYVEAKHVVGNLELNEGATPVPGHPIVIGIDWGARNVGLVFKQIIESDEGPYDITIGSISYYQEMHKTRELALAILDVMRYWTWWLWEQNAFDPETAEKDHRGALLRPAPSWCWWFIAGDDATTNFNPTTGNIHARDLMDHMEAVYEEDPMRYLAITLPQIRGCPRPKDSVSKRVDIMTEGLMTEMVAVSAICEDVKGMLAHLPRDKDIPSHPAKGNRWIHVFDAWSYPNYYRRFVLPGGFFNVDEGEAITV